ncbi:MAG: site-specific integrase, partial [Bacteroidota bacterium]
MATVTPILRTAKANAEGHSPIWLRFSDTHRSLYASLAVYIHPRYWNERKGEVRKGHPHSDRINALIQRRLSEAEDERLRLLTEREPVTAEALKAAVANEPAAEPSPCFLRYARAFASELERRGQVGRYKRENTILNKLEDFTGAPLPFEKLTPDLLRSYETHLGVEKGNKASTIQGNMKVLRTYFRRAMKEAVVPRDADPFFAYSPPKANRPKRHKLSEAELARLESLDLGERGPEGSLLARVRDYFLFSLYTAGARFADVARLRVENIVEDVTEDEERVLRLTYTMGKTGKRASVKLIAQARRIVRLYLDRGDGKLKASTDFLFPMLEEGDLDDPKGAWNAIGKQNALVNKYLRKLADMADVDGKLSFHVARHSFADLARRRGWDVYSIS